MKQRLLEGDSGLKSGLAQYKQTENSEKVIFHCPKVMDSIDFVVLRPTSSELSIQTLKRSYGVCKCTVKLLEI